MDENSSSDGDETEDPYDITKEFENNKIVIEEPKVPNGWMLSADSFGRKYYYNENDRERIKV